MTEPSPGAPKAREHAKIAAECAEWVRSFVVGKGMCPFAAPVVSAQLVRYVVAAAESDALDVVLGEAVHLLQTDPAALATTLVIVPGVRDSFESLLDLAAEAEGALQAVGADQHVQLPTFHPDYMFEGADPSDPANSTNRSPWPMIHLLRQEDVTRAVQAHPDPAAIPARNAKLLRDEAKP